MKKILALALAAIFVLSMLAMMVACGSDKDDSGDDTEETTKGGSGVFVEGIELPTGWTKFESTVPGDVSYVNLETGESIVISETEIYE